MTGPPAALEIEHLRISFHQYEAGLRRRTVTPVRDISLVVGPGQVVALIGGSGAGKSLIGLAALGLLPANAEEQGTIRLHGCAATAAQRRARAGAELAMLPQSVSFLDPLTRVGRQLRRAAELAGSPDPGGAVREALRRRDLPQDTGRRYPHELSGGMARRVLLALATMADPRILFADEPTPGLHPSSVREVLADIRAIADAGAAVVLVSHDIDQALTVADRVVVCQAGRTVETAVPAQFAGEGDALVHPYTRDLWRALPGHGFRRPDAAAASGAGGTDLRPRPLPGALGR